MTRPLNPKPGHSQKGQAGFTLVEVLVAVFIMGVATASILILIGQNTRFQQQGETRLLASIVADNVMVEALLDPVPLEVGEREGEVTLGNRSWIYQRTVGETSVDGLVTVAVVVRAAGSPQVVADISSLKSVGAP
ncbi:MAG: type II secretion system minor pseudopilin GspI [Pseudomonadota bacterium]